MTSPVDLDPRQQLRTQLRKERNALSHDAQLRAAKNIVTCLQTDPLAQKIQNASHIALYLSNDGEISPHSLCELFWSQKTHIYLPTLKDKSLVFAHYTKETIWKENRFGIKEPLTEVILQGEELDVVFLPLVGFDLYGGRLGMGGGFYDRTFANKKQNQKPVLIGLAHDCQQVERIPMESWDIPLEAIITPSRIIVTE